MTPLRLLLGWLAEGRRRMLAALDLLDDRLTDYGDDTMDLADSLDDEPHSDPNRHYREVGCLICRDTLVRIRATAVQQALFDFALWKHELGVVEDDL